MSASFALYDGTLHLGEIVENRGVFRIETVDGRNLGPFADRQAAVRAATSPPSPETTNAAPSDRGGAQQCSEVNR